MADLISRQMAIEALRKMLYKLEEEREEYYIKEKKVDEWFIYIRPNVQDMNDLDVETIDSLPSANPWHTGTPPVEEIDKDNQYCYALCFYYDGWWLSDYLFKANHEEGCFENSPNNGQKVCKFKFCETIAWRKIEPYKEKEK